MKQFTCAFVLAIAAAGAFAVCASDAAEARAGGRSAHDCKASIRAKGASSILKRAARQNAVQAWVKDAEAAAGPNYAKWEKARKKLVSCKVTERVMVLCVARGVPCK